MSRAFLNTPHPFRDFGGGARSASHTCEGPGDYRILVNVVEVFGNDTTEVVKARV